jgi:hypothetical protein
MELGSVLLGVAATLVLAAFVIDPLIKNPLREHPPRRRSAADGDALEALRELEFDFQTGKLNPEDYEVLRPRLLLAAAEQLQIRQDNSRVCPVCDQEHPPGDRFCTTCGRELSPERGRVEEGA